MILLPAIKIQKLKEAQKAIIPVIGNAVPLLRTLTATEAKVPIAICMHPITAEALPAFLLKGAIESAEELGKINPWQQRKIKMKKMVLNNSSHPKKVPAKSSSPVALWHSNATFIICSLL